MHSDLERLQEIGQGVERFRKRIFPNRRSLFERLAKAQHPKALFLTCADSRIVPSLITQTGPGELFVERNPGNIVPVYSEESVGVSASIEYAIVALEAPHLIVCGHSDCGAVKAILHPEKLAEMPAVARWLRFGDEARARLGRLEGLAGEDARLRVITELNVLVQMEHLQTHPSVQAAFRAGRLTIHGWVYEIATGEVWAYETSRDEFTLFPE
jgi:carbonic anhydrase